MYFTQLDHNKVLLIILISVMKRGNLRTVNFSEGWGLPIIHLRQNCQDDFLLENDCP